MKETLSGMVFAPAQKLSSTVRTYPIKARKRRVTYRIAVRSIRYSTNIGLALGDAARRVRWPSLVHPSQRRIPIHCHLLKEILGVLWETLVNSSINLLASSKKEGEKVNLNFHSKRTEQYCPLVGNIEVLF